MAATARPADPSQQRPAAARRSAGTDPKAWTARVNAALRDIAGGRVDKLVLSRSRRVEAAGSFSPALILGQLAEQQPDSLLYAHGQGELCFLGATPERLVRLDNGLAEADALAGTAWSGSLSLAEQKTSTNSHWSCKRWSMPSLRSAPHPRRPARPPNTRPAT